MTAYALLPVFRRAQMWAAWTEHKVFANRRQDLIAVIDKALKNNIVICCGA
jgi:hypothetical protein